MVGSVAVTLAVALGLIRWLAPQLLGVPVDLRLVSEARELPPFYEGVFRADDARQGGLILQDPVAKVRALPLYPDVLLAGPHDVLGFRNFSVPATADIVVIGDSQTYGVNSRLEQNWPSQMAQRLHAKRAAVYAMATGGWAAPQYLQMLPNALRLRPRLVVAAFYSGNDAAETYNLVYGAERWKDLRQGPPPSRKDLPQAKFPPAPADIWRIAVAAGAETGLTPRLRLASNDRAYPAVHAGWRSMAEAARRMAKLAQEAKVPLLVTLVPSKELVYAERAAATAGVPAEYRQLVHDEAANIAEFAAAMKAAGVRYVDLLVPMQAAAREGRLALYPANENGHPIAGGYWLIGMEIARAADEFLPAAPRGLVSVRYGNAYAEFLVNDEGAWLASSEMLEQNGWQERTPVEAQERDLATTPMRGPLRTVDRKRFGPEILKR